MFLHMNGRRFVTVFLKFPANGAFDLPPSRIAVLSTTVGFLFHVNAPEPLWVKPQSKILLGRFLLERFLIHRGKASFVPDIPLPYGLFFLPVCPPFAIFTVHGAPHLPCFSAVSGFSDLWCFCGSAPICPGGQFRSSFKLDRGRPFSFCLRVRFFSFVFRWTKSPPSPELLALAFCNRGRCPDGSFCLARACSFPPPRSEFFFVY